MTDTKSSQLIDRLTVTKEGFRRSQSNLPSAYANTTRRAWEHIHLDAVFVVDQKPIAYYKEVASVRDQDVRRWHRSLWNQGLVPLLIIVSNKDIEVYSSQALPAAEQDNPRGQNRLVKTLKRAAGSLEELLLSIEAGSFFSQHPDSFDRKHAVDHYLLSNLAILREQLTSASFPVEKVHCLLTRLIFTCYLLERGIVTPEHVAAGQLPDASNVRSLKDLLVAATPTRAKLRLYELFKWIRERFNGTTFEEDLDDEQELIGDTHITLLQRFLRGDDLGSGQLGFWAYDFSVIPVETISAIYEDFIAHESEQSRRSIGAYYTPPHLVELMMDMALEKTGSILGKRVLDPACGSGIFLVSAFNRIAEEWRSKNPSARNSTRARELRKLLVESVYGVDIKEAACRVACFSLYLALLDHLQSRDLEELHKIEKSPFLPPLLQRGGEKAGDGINRPIVHYDFLDSQLPLPTQSFGLIIGNPPWASRPGPSIAPGLDRWISEHPDQAVPGNQIAHAFMWKTPEYLADSGQACLLLPSAVHINVKTNDFQADWFAKHTVTQVIQLCDFRYSLFPHAKKPASVIFFTRIGQTTPAYIEYITPKTGDADPNESPIVIYPEDRKAVRLAELLQQAQCGKASLAWNGLNWGTPRDIRFLRRLLMIPPLSTKAGKPAERKRWVSGQGFKPYTPSDKGHKPKLPYWSADDLFLPAREARWNLVILSEDCEPIAGRFKKLGALPAEVIFKPPMVIVPQGISRVGFSRVGFCDLPAFFQHSLQSIAGPKSDEHLLMFLTAVLSSPLARYFLFHTSANWGSERDKVLLTELLQVPFPLPDETDDPPASREIVGSVASIMKTLKDEISNDQQQRDKLVREARTKTDALVAQYYDIDEYEDILIQDTMNVSIPSSTPSSGKRLSIPSLRKCRQDDRKQYTDTLCGCLNGWAEGSRFRVSGQVTYSSGAGLAVVTLRMAESLEDYTEEDSPSELTSSLLRIKALLRRKRGSVQVHRNMKVFDGQELHMIKPLHLRFWTRTAAFNDADELAASIIGDRST